MSAHAYTEDQLVEQPAIGLFAELGWQTVSALEEIFGSAEPSPVPSDRSLPVGCAFPTTRIVEQANPKGIPHQSPGLRAASYPG